MQLLLPLLQNVLYMKYHTLRLDLCVCNKKIGTENFHVFCQWQINNFMHFFTDKLIINVCKNVHIYLGLSYEIKTTALIYKITDHLEQHSCPVV